MTIATLSKRDQSTFAMLGSVALFACREPIARVAGADPWR